MSDASPHQNDIRDARRDGVVEPGRVLSAIPADMRPLVSVVVAFLNAERFLEAAVESVIAQTYAGWELLLVDDGSTDASTRIARKYAREHPDRIRYLQHEQHANRGVCASRNLGVGQARGELIAILDGDDVWLPHKIAEQVSLLKIYPEAAMVCGRALYWRSWADEDVRGNGPGQGWEGDGEAGTPRQVWEGDGGAGTPRQVREGDGGAVSLHRLRERDGEDSGPQHEYDGDERASVARRVSDGEDGEASAWTSSRTGASEDEKPKLGIPGNHLYHPPALFTRCHPLGDATAPCPSDVLVRRSVIEDIGGFEEEFVGEHQLYEDQAFFVKIYLRYPVFVADRTWIRYRIHPNSCMARATDPDGVRRYFLDWLEGYLQRENIEPAIWRSALDAAYRPRPLTRLTGRLKRMWQRTGSSLPHQLNGPL